MTLVMVGEYISGYKSEINPSGFILVGLNQYCKVP
jgi:hypothetical protein